MDWEALLNKIETDIGNLGFIKSSKLFDVGYIADTEPDLAFCVIPDSIEVSNSQTLGGLTLNAKIDINVLFLLNKINSAKIMIEIEKIINYIENELAQYQEIDNARFLSIDKMIDAKGKGIIYKIKIEIQYFD